MDDKSQRMIKEVESEFCSSANKMAPYLVNDNTSYVDNTSSLANLKAAQT